MHDIRRRRDSGRTHGRPGLSRLPVLLGTGVVSRLQVLLGTGVITDTLLDLKLKVSPSSFFQVLQ